MFKIFISYRRGDTFHVAQRIYDQVAKHFPGQVFCDIHQNRIGENWRDNVWREAENCQAMIIVIGKHWKEDNPDGSRRIDDPNDVVRKEVEIALSRRTAFPVLLHPTAPLAAAQLPESIRELADIEAHTIYEGRQFESSVRALIDELLRRKEERLGLLSRTANRISRALAEVRRPVSLAVMLVVAIAVALGVVWYQRNFDRKGRRVDEKVVNTWERADRMKLQKEIEAMKARPPMPDLVRSDSSEEVESLGTPDYGSFDLLSDERFWDLRGWKDLSNAKAPNQQSIAIMTRTIRLRKAEAANEVRFESRTDGEDIFIKCLSTQLKWRELLQSQHSFVGARRTKVRQLAVDISDVPVEEEVVIRYRATYLNSLQDKNDRWIGATGYPRSDRIRLIVLLPENAPLKGFRLQTAPSTRDKAVDFDGPRRIIEASDKSSLMWEIPNPEAGFVYSVVLDW